MSDTNKCDKCDKCGKDNGGRGLHTCPYAVELYDDCESKCNCCSECTRDCADDI